ncbi:hypothetical protein LA303_00420 [Candidatus Sulfidibacterium hydrothermale]|uniref:hypothetical protein n=1 Tax=Candidatus Sulfidibacterium hydrothermale TaxID=2875962 RepID=UPI001F0B698A|nr:hypothetical protein [Candidatus Sulfidibacterium hydrothermale]UBM62461.1 hypothetical protein LA303_00420 [Candidatus Sulfidibacterium hydrothermale]
MINIFLKIKSIFHFFSLYLGVLLKPQNRYVYKKYRAIIKLSKQSEKKQIDALLKHVNEILNYANKHTVYYYNIFKKANWVKSKNDKIELKSLSEIENLPILTKTIIRENFDDLTSDESELLNSYINSSGGSTGEKAMFLQHELFKRNHTANFLFFLRQIGIKPWQKHVFLIWGASQDIGRPTLPKNLFKHFIKNNTITMNSSSLTKKEMKECVYILNKIKFDYIRGYSQSLYNVALYINKNNIKIKPQNKIISTATLLTKEMRFEIEKAFSCEVYDFYGSREVGAISFEDKSHQFWNVLINNNLVEIVGNNKRKICKRKNGKMLLTTLNNYAMPLIRYDIGDTAKIINDKVCFDYLHYQELTGRTASNLYKKNGDIIDGTFLTTIFNSIEDIEQFQIIQHDYENIEFLIKTTNFNKISNDKKLIIEDNFKKMFGSDCKLNWTYVENTPRTESGKHLYVISNIRKDNCLN